MNVKKFAGKALMGLGLFLMLIGTTSVPSVLAGPVVVVPCPPGCNACGTPENQKVGGPKCIRKGSTSTPPSLGNCRNDKGCNRCSGGCEVIQQEGKDVCVCSVR